MKAKKDLMKWCRAPSAGQTAADVYIISVVNTTTLITILFKVSGVKTISKGLIDPLFAPQWVVFSSNSALR